jgi:CheY-like chemotaxis protein
MISANAPISEETVFVVDDDEAVRDSMRWLLEGNGYRVVTFASAEAFLEMVEPHAGGCLIADIRMPGMSGNAQTAPRTPASTRAKRNPPNWVAVSMMGGATAKPR